MWVKGVLGALECLLLDVFVAIARECSDNNLAHDHLIGGVVAQFRGDGSVADVVAVDLNPRPGWIREDLRDDLVLEFGSCGTTREGSGQPEGGEK